MTMMMLLMLQESESENRHRAIRLNSVNFKMARKEQRHFQVLEEAFSQVFSILVAISRILILDTLPRWFPAERL